MDSFAGVPATPSFPERRRNTVNFEKVVKKIGGKSSQNILE